jgi:hypothetical protein
MEDQTDNILKSVVETLLKKEANKFRGMIQKELASKVHAKIEELKKALSGSSVSNNPTTVKEVGGAMAPSAPAVTSPSNDMGVSSPAPIKPLKKKDIKIVPTAAGANKDDVSLDPNFEKEFYVSSYDYKGQHVIVKQIGTGFGKPVRVYVNDRRWEFFPGPTIAAKATKEYIDGMIKTAMANPDLARSMTDKIAADKKLGVASAPPQADAAKEPPAAAAPSGNRFNRFKPRGKK